MSGTVIGESPVGLRARKRASTTATIESAAVALALEHGYDAVTVDMICAASSVSPRTFFNYFGSKEGAVLGTGTPEPSEEERAAFLASTGPDVLTELVTMLASVLAERRGDRDLLASRRALVTANPGLITKQLVRMAELESELVGLVLDRLRRQVRSPDAASCLEDEAAMVVALAGSVLRFSVRRWFAAEDARAGAHESLRADLALARRVVVRSDAPVE